MKLLYDLIKKTPIYSKIYKPWQIKRLIPQRERFHKEGRGVLEKFVKCMESQNITYWLEFGTLLGAYRDGAFIPNDLDLDFGTFLKDARKIYDTLTQNGFTLIREFHVVGENGLEQTYEYNGVTLDVMYFYEYDHFFWCNGCLFPRKKNKIVQVQVTSHWFKPFDVDYIDFLGLKVSVPRNTEEHLIEIFGLGYKIYDPNFRGDLNKKLYTFEEKVGSGFAKR